MSIAEQLAAHHVYLQPHGKTVQDLEVEIARGEATLAIGSGGQLERHLRVAVVHIHGPGGWELMHVAKKCLRTSKRYRECSHLSEKQMRGETPLAAAQRGVAEELGPWPVDRWEVGLEEEARRGFGAYGNLATRYQLTHVTAHTSAAPSPVTFQTTELPKWTHEWEWKLFLSAPV